MKSEAAAQGPAADLNVEWVVNMANNDSSRQAANIEDLINSGVDIIITRALDAAAIGASIRRAEEAGIPFVTFDRASSGAQPTAHVGGDSEDQAKVLGEEFVKILVANNVDAKCVELQGSLADINAINRTNEFESLTRRRTTSRSLPRSRPSGIRRSCCPVSPTPCGRILKRTASSPHPTGQSMRCRRRSKSSTNGIRRVSRTTSGSPRTTCSPAPSGRWRMAISTWPSRGTPSPMPRKRSVS